MGELLVLLVCWKWGPYGVPNQQGDGLRVWAFSFAQSFITDSYIGSKFWLDTSRPPCLTNTRPGPAPN